MMPYMVSYMRQHSWEALNVTSHTYAVDNSTLVTSSYSNQTEALTYGKFIVVLSAWGITQGIVLPVGGAMVSFLGKSHRS